MLDQTVLHRVEMRVVHVRRGSRSSLIVCSQYRRCQIPRLPPRIMTDDRCSPMRTDFQNPFLIAPPTAREIGVASRQCPQAVHVVGKHGPGVNVERRVGADLPNRIPQRVDLCHQQVRPAVQQVHSEEECPTWNPIATIIRHDGIMPGFGERRKALRFSALRVLIGLGFTREVSARLARAG